jgi:hypothetical protein
LGDRQVEPVEPPDSLHDLPLDLVQVAVGVVGHQQLDPARLQLVVHLQRRGALSLSRRQRLTQLGGSGRFFAPEKIQ